MRKDDVSTQTARTKLISGATTSNGASLNPPTVYQMLRDSYALIPMPDPRRGPQRPSIIPRSDTSTSNGPPGMPP
jgi:hypothetical protein